MGSESTPPFLLWALERACPLRQIDRWTDPERTERHLRAAQEAGSGIAEGRVIDGVCLGRECFAAEDPTTPTGFDVAAALAMYGGEEFVRSTCTNCPANVGRVFNLPLAGCFGLLPLTDDDKLWSELAAASPLIGETARTQSQRISFAAPEFAAALSVAATLNLPLHLRRFPAGRIEGRRWIVPAHCERCGAVRIDLPCPSCGSNRPPIGERRRHVRGTRPYFDLRRLVGDTRAAELLARSRPGEG